MMTGVGAQNVGQHDRVGVIGLGSGNRVALPVARHGQRIDGIHVPSRRPQARHQKAPAGFDGHRNEILSSVAMFRQHLQQ